MVDEPWEPGAGPRADAMVTCRPRHRPGHRHRRLRAGAVRRAGVVGAAHAGWRGALAGCWRRPSPPCARCRQRQVRSSPRSARASARPATRSRLTCATPCWPATRRMSGSSPMDALATGCSTCRAIAWPGCAPPGPRRTWSRRHAAGCRPLLQPSPPHPGRWRPDRSSDINHWMPYTLIRPTHLAALALALSVAGCGDLPHPFQDNPGATAIRLSQPPPARLSIPMPTASLLDGRCGAQLVLRPGRCAGGEGIAGRRQPDPQGRLAPGPVGGNERQHRDPDLHGAGSEGPAAGQQPGGAGAVERLGRRAAATFKAAAEAEAPKVIALLNGIEAEQQMSDPHSLLNRPPKVYFFRRDRRTRRRQHVACPPDESESAQSRRYRARYGPGRGLHARRADQDRDGAETSRSGSRSNGSSTMPRARSGPRGAVERGQAGLVGQLLGRCRDGGGAGSGRRGASDHRTGDRARPGGEAGSSDEAGPGGGAKSGCETEPAGTIWPASEANWMTFRRSIAMRRPRAAAPELPLSMKIVACNSNRPWPRRSPPT